jgi:hypothetical protein
MVVDMERVNSIIKTLIDNDMINDIINDGYFQPWNWFHEHEGLLPGKYKVYSGACKGVIVFDDTDWVIKFDYYGEDSYCKIEADNYRYAVEEGLAHYFAETRFITQVDCVSFVIQEKCECDESDIYDSLHQYVKETYDEECSEYSEASLWEEVESICANGCVHEMFHDKALNAFVCRYYINDLHAGNFGRVNGRIVMTDYSGF